MIYCSMAPKATWAQSRSGHLCGRFLHACSRCAFPRSIGFVSRSKKMVRNVCSPCCCCVRRGFRALGLVHRRLPTHRSICDSVRLRICLPVQQCARARVPCRGASCSLCTAPGSGRSLADRRGILRLGAAKHRSPDTRGTSKGSSSSAASRRRRAPPHTRSAMSPSSAHAEREPTTVQKRGSVAEDFLNACTPPRTMRGPPGLLLAIMLGAAVAVPAATTCADYIRHGLEACARAYACSVPSHGRGPQAAGDSTALCRAHSVWASLSELNCRHLPACPRRQDGRSHTRCGAKCCCGANAGGGPAAVDLCACQARALRSGSKSTSAPGRSKPVTASALTCQDTPKPCS